MARSDRYSSSSSSKHTHTQHRTVSSPPWARMQCCNMCSWMVSLLLKQKSFLQGQMINVKPSRQCKVIVRETFAKIVDVLWELQLCTAQGGGEQANGLLERSMETDVTEHRVSQQLCRGGPGEDTQKHDASIKSKNIHILMHMPCHKTIPQCLMSCNRINLPFGWKKSQAFP